MKKNIQKVKFKIAAFIFVLLILIASSFIPAYRAMVTQNQDALVINLSARQTTIVHRYIKDFLYFLQTDQIEPVNKSISVFEETLKSLLHGGMVQVNFDSDERVQIKGTTDLATIKLLQRIDHLWNELKNVTVTLIDDEQRTVENFRDIMGKSDALSKVTLKATSLIQENSEKNLSRIKIYQNIIYLISFILFALTIVLFYRVGILNQVLARKVDELEVDIVRRQKAEKEREDIRQQMFQSSKLASIGELAAGVGHEINNPLAIINGHIDIIRERFAEQNVDDPVCKRALDVQRSAVGRIVDIVDGLRSFARTDGDKLEIFSVNDLINNTILFLTSIYKREGVEIKLNLTEEDTCINGNSGRFQQVLINLLSNAKDATESLSERKIIIETRNEDSKILMRVIDNGIGMSQSVIEKMFDSFFTTKEVGKGTGLGMGIIKNIVENIEGKIDIESKIGKGTSITILIPRSDVKINGKGLETSDEIHYEKLSGRALVVDDEEDIRDILTTYLNSFGIEVDLAADGNTAMLKVQKGDYDYILTDLTMPGMSGVELIEKVSLMEKFHGKIYVITGAVIADKLKNLPVDGIINKPFDKQTIYNQLSNFVCELKTA